MMKIPKIKKRWKILTGAMVAIIALALADMVAFAPTLDPVDSDKIIEGLMILDPPCDPASVRWAWLDGPRNYIGKRIGLCASYRAISNTVVIPRYLEPIAADPIMFSTYAHELTHAAQRERWGVLGYLWKKIFNRALLEDEALAYERQVEMSVGVAQ